MNPQAQLENSEARRQTPAIDSVKRNTNLPRQSEISIRVFFKSSIGPNSKNTKTEDIGKEAAKLLAITASELEHNELKYAIAIIAGIAIQILLACILEAGSAPNQARITEATIVPHTIIGKSFKKSS